MEFAEILENVTRMGVSDVFVVAGRPLSYRLNGVLTMLNDTRLLPADTEKLVREIYRLSGGRDIEPLLRNGDDDFSFALPGVARFRVSAYKQRGSLALVIRVISFELPDADSVGIPKEVVALGNLSKGLVLVTGPAGSGKSTTQAAIIDHINRTKEKHIITLEDPLEYLHTHRKSVVSQREVNSDTQSYMSALRAALRQSPDVILLGEMRDYETIQVVMTAAETGHLIISTLHTLGAGNTVDRIIDVFPAEQQRQIAVQLSMCLQAVVCQQLVPTVDGRIVPAFEIMEVTPAIRNMIRENKIPQIEGIVYSSSNPTMISMDNSLLKLCKEGTISKETALMYATNPDMLKKKL